MRAVHAILALLLTAPVLGASALDPPEVGVATTPPAMGTDDTCLARVVPPGVPPAPSLPVALPCADLPVFVDEGGDTMTGDLRLENLAGLDFANGGRLTGFSATSLRYGGRGVCLAGTTLAGCGDIEAVTAGTGLTGGASSGTVALSVDAGVIQRRVTASCAAGSAIRGIAVDGSVTCEADDGQVYTGSAPVSVSGTTIGLSSTGCVSGDTWKWLGVWACEPAGTVTSITAGPGLTGGTITGTGTLAVAAGGIATAMLADGAVAGPKLAPGSIDGAKVRDFSLAGTDLANLTVGTLQLADAAVTPAKLSFDPATQAEMDGHKTGGDHDARYLRTSPASAQAASMFISGTARTTGKLRTGSESGTTHGPGEWAFGYDGLVVRRTVADSAGDVVARTDSVELRRGSGNGWTLAWTSPLPSDVLVHCLGMDGVGNQRNRRVPLSVDTPPGSATLYSSADDPAYFHCTMGVANGHVTTVDIMDTSFAGRWVGTLASTYNQ